MNNIKYILATIYIMLILTAVPAYGLGLRSLVAAPVATGDFILRETITRNTKSDVDTAISNIAYGITAKSTIMAGLPYRLSPSGNNRIGDLGFLYRYIAYQDDKIHSTNRFALLAGGIIPIDNSSDGGIQGGLTGTYFKKRHEIDYDFVYQHKFSSFKNKIKYDLSWQYRLTPSEMPEWGLPHSINSVLEYGGRWTENSKTNHQLTAGIQSVWPRFILEGGITHSLTNSSENIYLISVRLHI